MRTWTMSEASLFQDIYYWMTMSVSGSFISYFSFAGLLHYRYYIRKRQKPEEWKCQPERFLPAEMERQGFMLGCFNMFIGGIISGILCCFIMNGGKCTMYFRIGEHGWLYLVLSTAFVFIMADVGAYYVHKTMHIPVIYRNIHKHHHRYYTPNALTAVAMHPLEFISLQSVLVIPVFTVPIYSGAYLFIVLYTYYYGVIDHSGIKLDSIWPWQPNSMFHDDHHKYYHVNFGTNLKVWDLLHDTYRREDRMYGENIFYGKGVPKTFNQTN